ncbi:retinoic acid receptor responder protein 1 [Tachyglossus aculeatus]|uniref:retinoic acid receptor responder protein 1 n=1 Tax=Tachyglossus aculeatus TaxID=9261 RepID=UPI0018F40B8E|nr:retinoic acid receptor responder protein 1 [Tachyglossus aculeatus]
MDSSLLTKKHFQTGHLTLFLVASKSEKYFVLAFTLDVLNCGGMKWQLVPLDWPRERAAGWRERAAGWRERAAGGGRGREAARAALHYLNSQARSPAALRALRELQRAALWVNPEKGQRIDVVFTTSKYASEENEYAGTCFATVVFRNNKPSPAVNITCTPVIGEEERELEAVQMYKQLKELAKPTKGTKIPDNYGFIEPSLKPMWYLAVVGGSYVMWQKTSLSLYYYMLQLTDVKQWVTDDDAIQFGYTALLHEFSTQEIIPCQINLIWYPGKILKVKYHCQNHETQLESSGNEGSATGTEEVFSNF